MVKVAFTALMHAAMIDNISYLVMLLNGGADPNIPNYDDGANSSKQCW